MNKERLLELAAVLRSEDRRRAALDGEMAEFDMRYEFRSGPEIASAHGCGTIMCIAGFAAAMFDPEGLSQSLTRYGGGVVYGSQRVAEVARIALNLERRQSQALFYPDSEDAYGFSAEMAAGVIERFVETGVVHWPSLEDASEDCSSPR